jgi:signal transduction histidine kinase
MELDSRFTQDDAPRRQQGMFSESRPDWVGVQLSRTFIANARTALASVLLALPITIAMLYGLVPTPWLALWSVAVMAMAVYRQWIVVMYRRRYVHANAATLNAFLNRHQWTWPASAVLWAGLLFLYLQKIPMANQFICMLVLVGMGAFSSAFMSARLDCFRPYVHGLSLTSMCAAVASWHRSGSWAVGAFDVTLLLLMVLFWALVLSSGRRLNALQRRGYELQYDNERLIASLREETDKAVQAVTVKNNLLANAAHDLRQPVHALAFYADWLRNEPDVAAEVVPKILQATDSVNTLFNSLFDFAKLEAGAVQPQFKAVPVCEIVNDLIIQFGPAAETKGLALRQRISPAYVWTDSVLVRRIVGNLVANAVRYTDQGGVLIATRRRKDSVWIEVWDTGVGIAPEHHTQVFKEFYKASHHEGTEDGFGLGLAIVRRLVDVLGHTVHLRSQLGRGTCMRVQITLAAPPAPL